jgi:hypothetical protein
MPSYMPNIQVFSLADVLAKKQALADAQQMNQFNQMKMQEYSRNQQQQQTLGDIMGQSITTTGGIPAVPEQVMPEGVLGPPQPGTPEVPGRTDFNYDKMFQQAQNLDPRLRGPILQQLHAARTAEEDRRMAMAVKLQQMKGEGQGLQHPFDLEDASGNLYKGYTTKSGQQVVQDARGRVVDPTTVPGLKITKGNTYIQVAGPNGQTVVQPAPRAGGGSQSYRAPVQGDIEQVGKEYKESLEPIVPVIDRLDKLITPIEKDGGKIPGVGFANNTRIGQLANDKGVGGSIYRDATALSNAILKIRSGLAVTAQEEARTLIEMGRNPLASASAFMDQFRKLQDSVDKMHNRIGSQYGNAATMFDERQRASGGYLVSKSPWQMRREQEQSGKVKFLGFE